MRHVLSPLFIATALAFCSAAHAQVPQGYPADYAKIVDAAKKEGKVVIYATTDADAAKPLIKDFEALYPGIKVEYNDMNSTELYNRFIAEAAAGHGTADVLWSSAMDLQVKLVDDGHAATYASPEIKALPKWAVWKNQAYGTTYEPVAFVYNKRLVPAGDVPKDHADLLKLLTAKPDNYKGKVTTYDLEKIGVGFMFCQRRTSSISRRPGTWSRPFGKAQAKLYTSAGAMMERVTSGEHLIGYNMFGSYALARSKKDPNLGIVLPKDYTLVTSRVAFISKQGEEPERRQAVPRLHAVEARPEHHRQPGRALFAARRRRGRGHRQAGVTELVGDKARPVPIRPDAAGRTSTRRSGSRSCQAVAGGDEGTEARSQYPRSCRGRRAAPGQESAIGRVAGRIRRSARVPERRATCPLSRDRLLVLGVTALAVLAPLSLVFYQSFLTAPFFDAPAKLGLDAYAFVFADRDFWQALLDHAR